MKSFSAAVQDDPSSVTLADKYRLDRSTALISGRQALVRLPIVQRELDRSRGLNTAGLISGYRGSPLGSYDLELWKAAELLEQHNVSFQPGLNEDLALTALAGAQQLDFVPGRKVDGVFGIWYGKGPGVDRSGDAIKHANLQGVAAHGGILIAFGDDHTGKSSTTAHQSDLTLASWGVPVLYPSSVAEILTFGLAGIALSRFSGLLVGLKLVNETADGTGVVSVAGPPEFVTPEVPMPEGGVHIRREMRAMQEQDQRLLRYKLPRTQAFARANRLDHISFGSASARFVIATAGKAFADVLAALATLGVTDSIARKVGIGVYKIVLIFPLDPAGLEAATEHAEEIFFVEEKRPHAETQAAALLYNRARRPRISGKTTPDGQFLLPADMPLDTLIVAAALAERLRAGFPELAEQIPDFASAARGAIARATTQAPAGLQIARRPAFCPGCPHNTSTVVPEGSYGGTGIGCHTMVLFHPERNPLPVGHMGAEGANWIGLAPFTETRHIFQNLGDGTYTHSGSLAIRAAVFAGVNITFKILLNDAVAMTGGQPVEGHLTAARVVEQVRAEGVSRVVVVSDQPEHFGKANPLPADTELRHRDELAAVQEALRLQSGVTVIVYEQTCAAEKRRRRKLEAYPDPPRRIFINSLVCEGCGDCSVQSNCLAIQPLETELGRKRKIEQSACNKDFSCVKGFCPSFITVEGGKPRRSVGTDLSRATALATPTLPRLDDGFDMVIAGIGGTGVLTVSAILGMAARIEGLGVSLYDMTGLSQKGGQVFSHVRIRRDPDTVVAARVGPGEAHVILACDLIAAVQPEVLETLARGKTQVFGNADTVATADFQTHRDLSVPPELLISRLASASGREPSVLPAGTLSQRLLGDSIGANLLMLGFAWQRGAIPLQRESIEKAIALNGKAVEANLKAFAAGRLATLDGPTSTQVALSLQDFISRRATDLTLYWNAAYARRYTELLSIVSAATASLADGDELTWAVARSAYKLMAYKDEYEVARLYTDGRFREALAKEFDAVGSIRIHLAPPLLAKPDKTTGRIRKREFGGWVLGLFRILHASRGLREGPLDLFGRTAERRLERDLRDAYVTAITQMARTLSAENLANAVAIAAAPQEVRGFGHVKDGAARALLTRLRSLIG
jgi:indolepyruvate ferredoxin oxidoreductase